MNILRFCMTEGSWNSSLAKNTRWGSESGGAPRPCPKCPLLPQMSRMGSGGPGRPSWRPNGGPPEKRHGPESHQANGPQVGHSPSFLQPPLPSLRLNDEAAKAQRSRKAGMRMSCKKIAVIWAARRAERRPRTRGGLQQRVAAGGVLASEAGQFSQTF